MLGPVCKFEPEPEPKYEFEPEPYASSVGGGVMFEFPLRPLYVMASTSFEREGVMGAMRNVRNVRNVECGMCGKYGSLVRY